MVNVIELQLSYTSYLSCLFFATRTQQNSNNFVKINVNSHICGFLCSQSLDLICTGSAQKMEEMRQRYTYYQFQFSIDKGR